MTGTQPTEADARHMARALELAQAGWGRVHPNPMVGAVVVADGEVVGEGAHREFGGPHAEVEALQAAGDRSRGATLYVTLEPCCHHGKTPPCTDAIRESGIARVVYAVGDPDPVARGGAARLAADGVDVVAGVRAREAERQIASFLVPATRSRPFVALKFGLSLDARIAAVDGEATRVTGAEAEAEVHRLRAGFDAILVGGRTAEVDDPRLTVRHGPQPRTPPIRIVADPTARLDPRGRLARTTGDAPVWLLTAESAAGDRAAALEDLGVRVIRVPELLARSGRGSAGPDGSDSDPGPRLDMAAALDALLVEGVRSVLCEGGGRLGAALLEADRVDRLYLFLAPTLFGAAGVPAFPGDARFRGTIGEVRRLGEDVLVTVDRSG